MKTKLYSLSFLRSLKFLFVTCILFFGVIVYGQSYTIFDEGTDAPPGGPTGGNANNNDLTGFGVTTSVKFMVAQAGTISSVKFYKGDQNTGLHVGTLFLRDPDDNSNSIIGQVTFTGETPDGWQEMAFAAPIPVSPNRIYTMALFSENGVYAANNTIYQWNPSGNTAIPAFTILAGDGNTDPTGIGNGAYIYTDDPDSYPVSSFNSSNYFIDVVFTPTFLLPVTLTNFKAIDKNYDVNLSWETQMEENNAGFEVQRSVNGSDYSAITFIEGAGESASRKTYAYTDRNLEPGLYYYRLKQIDRDGTVKFSSVETATISRRSHIVLYQNFPNPVRNRTSIQYVLPSTLSVTLSLVDINGRVISVLENGRRQAGKHTVELDASTLMKGTYFYKLEAEGHPVEVKGVVVW